jgi:hypothetical protein
MSSNMNNINTNLKFRLKYEENGEISIFDLLITRNKDKLANDIFWKPDTTIYYNLRCPTEYKLATYRFLLNRMIQLPPLQESEKFFCNNGCPLPIIMQLNNRIKNKNKICYLTAHIHGWYRIGIYDKKYH